MAKVAFIGLGVMGYPMAGHLKARGGHDVTVYNRTAAKAEQWAAAFGGRTAATPAEAAKDQDFVFACVGNDDDLRSVTTGENGAFETMAPGSVFIDTRRHRPRLRASSMRRRRRRGRISSSAGLRRTGRSGKRRAHRHVRGRCGSLRQGQAHHRSLCPDGRFDGPAGAGQLTKMINQICIAGLVQGLAEGIHFGKKAGLDIEKVIEVISKGAAGSWQMENRHKTMNEGKYDFGFAVDWMRKDLDIVLAEARHNGAKLPVTALVDQFYGDIQALGGNRWDTSSLLARLEK